MTRALVISPLVLVASLVAAPVASAGDIKVEHVVPTCTGGDECRYFTEQPYDNHTFVAKDGEVNAVVATRGTNGTVTFRDDGAPIADASNCTRLAANEVRCTTQCHGEGMVVMLGEGGTHLAQLATELLVTS